MGPEATLHALRLHVNLLALGFSTCQERCYINDRTLWIATFCMLKAFSQVDVYVNDFSQGGFEVPG